MVLDERRLENLLLEESWKLRNTIVASAFLIYLGILYSKGR